MGIGCRVFECDLGRFSDRQMVEILARNEGEGAVVIVDDGALSAGGGVVIA